MSRGGRADTRARRPRRRWRARIRHKLVALIACLIAGLVTLLIVILSQQHEAWMRRELELKAAGYGRLVSEQVRSAVAFDDVETAREIFAAVARDRDVTALALYYEGGRLLYAHGAISERAARIGRAPRAGPAIAAVPAGMIVSAPVASLEGPRGVLVIELSTAALTARRAREVWTEIALGAVATLLGAVLAVAIGRSFARRIEAVSAAATAVADGELDQRPVDDRGGDEIGAMARAFNAMLVQLRVLINRIHSQVQADSERRIVQRTGALDSRNRELQLVLDNVEQGVLTVDRAGRIRGARSAIVERWLGPPREDEALWDFIGRADPEAGEWIAVCWDAFDGILPLSLSIDQLPARFRRDAEHFSLEYTPVRDEAGTLRAMLVVLEDITGEVERDRAERDQRELLTLVARVVEDRDGFAEFFAELKALVATLRACTPSSDPREVERTLHTLKGNCAIFGLDTVAALCGQLEGAVEATGRPPERGELERLLARVDVLGERIEDILGVCPRAVVEIARDDYERALAALHRGVPVAQVARVVASWDLEPTAYRLRRAAAQAERLARLHGKTPLAIAIEDGALRVDGRQWSRFWSAFIHVLRNAIDHGIETAADRERAGKTAPATLTLRSEHDGDEFRIVARDNGRGIDWLAVRARAAARGLPHATRDELVAALFCDGISTRGEPSELSGRGVGLGAVEAACEASGGRIEVVSAPGGGAEFRFIWPASAIAVIDPRRDAPLVYARADASRPHRRHVG